MGRTNVVVDDELVERVMARYSLSTKREAIDFALRQAAGDVMTRDEALGMRGIGWELDLADVRRPMELEEW